MSCGPSRYWVMVLLAVGVAGTGCRRRNERGDKDTVRVSPVRAGAQHSSAVAPPTRPAVGRSRKPDWRTATDASAARPDAAVAAQGSGSVAVDAGQDAESAEARALRQTEDAVSSALEGAAGRMKRCYDQARTHSASTTIKLRLHRSGYVMSSIVEGADPVVRKCLSAVFDQLRVRGVQQDSITVERTLRLESQAR